MSTYIRGPICGVGNCPSRLWRIIDGRRTCQFGHVMEGDIEYNDEDEDTANVGVVTRRLNLTTSATGSFQSSINLSQFQNSHSQEGGKKIFGPEARLLFIRSLQFTLKRQSKWLISEYNLPSEFDKVIKIIWMKLLKSMEESDDDDDEEEEEEIDKRGRPQRRRDTYRLSLVSTLAVLYLSSVQMGIPIYIYDLTKWIMSGRLPYFKSNERLPESWRVRLPSYYLGILEGGKGPQKGQIFTHVAQVCSKINFAEEFNNEISYHCLLLKLVLSTVLPPEFFLFSVQLIESTSKDQDFNLSPDTNPQSWVELQIAVYLLLTIRWLLMYDTNSYKPKWIHAFLNRQKRRDVSLETINQNMLRISKAHRPAQEIFSWSEEETAQYLSWAQEIFLPMQRNDHNLKIDQMIARRKLHKLFPLQSETFSSGDLYDTQKKISFLNELQERYAFFQKQLDSSADDRDDEQLTDEEHIKAIKELENHMAQTLSVEFSVSLEQLRLVTNKISQKCLERLDKNHENEKLKNKQRH